METMRLRVVARAVALALSLLATGAQSAEADVSNLYVFGDSLSDNGNLAEVYYQQNFPNPPSAYDSFTNGQVAAASLATSLGRSLTPSLWVTGFQDPVGLFGGAAFTPGTNYAVAGATSAASLAGIDLPQQVAAFSAFSGFSADANALYLVMIGGNDVRNAALYGTGLAAITAGVQSELVAIQTLIMEGARNFLVVNVPNVGVIPEFAQDNPSLASAATAYSQIYDSKLAHGLASLLQPAHTNIKYFDLFQYNANLLANAASYGLTDLTDPCFTNTPLSASATTACGVAGANIDHFAYWDSIHPTSTVHALWAAGFEASLSSPVPEPETAVLLIAGVMGLVGMRARARRKSKGSAEIAAAA